MCNTQRDIYYSISHNFSILRNSSVVWRKFFKFILLRILLTLCTFNIPVHPFLLRYFFITFKQVLQTVQQILRTYVNNIWEEQMARGGGIWIRRRKFFQIIFFSIIPPSASSTAPLTYILYSSDSYACDHSLAGKALLSFFFFFLFFSFFLSQFLLSLKQNKRKDMRIWEHTSG